MVNFPAGLPKCLKWLQWLIIIIIIIIIIKGSCRRLKTTILEQKYSVKSSNHKSKKASILECLMELIPMNKTLPIYPTLIFKANIS